MGGNSLRIAAQALSLGFTLVTAHERESCTFHAITGSVKRPCAARTCTLAEAEMDTGSVLAICEILSTNIFGPPRSIFLLTF